MTSQKRGIPRCWNRQGPRKPELITTLGVVVSPLEKLECEGPKTPLGLEGGIDLH